MYLVELKTALTEATKHAFGDEHPDSDFRNLHISIEYPVDRQAYPSIWIDYDPTLLRTAGIGHSEDSFVASGGTWDRAFRWRFQGNATLTCVAFTSLQRDRLFDAVVRMIAFSEAADSPTPFRSAIETNAFIGMTVNFDEVEQRGFGAGQGTPWGTDEMIYEATLSIGVQGEFVATADGSLLNLSTISVFSWAETLEFDTTTGDGWIG